MVTIGLGSMLMSPVQGHELCHHCQQTRPCTKVCRLKQEKKKVTVTWWGTECEEFCVTGPSQECTEHCEPIDCSDKKVHSLPKAFRWIEWLAPEHAEMLTKKKLMKKQIEKEISVWVWKVEDLCAQCKENVKEEKARSDKTAGEKPKEEAVK